MTDCTHHRRELQAMAAATAELQLVSLPLLRSGDVRRNRQAGACSPETFGLVVECLAQAYALQGVPYGSQSAARQALVDTLRYQIEVGRLGTGSRWDGRGRVGGRAGRLSWPWERVSA